MTNKNITTYQILTRKFSNDRVYTNLLSFFFMSNIFVLAMGMSSFARAGNNTNNNNRFTISPNKQQAMLVDVSGMAVNKHDVALIHVLSEICPNLLNTSQQNQFNHTYNSQLQRLMPTINNPQNAVKYLSSQKDYRQVHSSMKKWTLGFSQAENKALCEEMANMRITQF